MAIFQKSIINKYLKNLDDTKVNNAFVNFQKFYGDKLRLHNITQLKEENYQEGFLREIFVETLGYTINPDKNYNLTTEFKNQKDARKADGAILKDEKAIAVIELKSTKTKDLESIKEQAFSYKVNHKKCTYVITSNFQYLRFYIDNATEYEEFDLFNLNKSDFKFFYLLLTKESIFANLPLRLKEETKFHEEDISNKLYTDYKRFKTKIFNNLVKNNQKYDKLILFKKSQKLLDRFLFVFFAEDCGLIPPNMITKVIERWKILIENDVQTSLYNQFQKLFTYIDKGKTFKNWGTIPAYNGGLFKEDKILDSLDLKIEDHILEKDSLKISTYNFDTEVDINILGHIFEHSLTEIEEIERSLTLPKSQTLANVKTSKRKKDGIFYTPKFITNYIVENTVGKLCKEKKNQIKIHNLSIDNKYKQKNEKLNQAGKQLFETLKNYKKWLLDLKIIDPACGSGAFLNATLDFLISEHTQIDNLITELSNEKIRLFDTNKSILENNLFGVDINEESVEIAKLSLWLRTAQRGRILSDLNNNIKCGNSLIDNIEVEGKKAFKWNKEFPEIMNNGGFDVVLGNPPYVQIQGMGEMSEKLKNQNFITYEKSGDLYCLFYEQGNNILKQNGLLGFITSNKWMRANYGKKLRRYFAEQTEPKILIDLAGGIFESATVDSNILIFKKNKVKKHKLIAIDLSNEKNIIDIKKLAHQSIILTNLSDDIWTISNPIQLQLINKINKIGTILKDWDISIYRGILTGYNEAFIINTITKNKIIKDDPNSLNIIKPILRGRDIKRYQTEFANLWLIATFPSLNIEINNYPGIKKYLKQFLPKIKQTGETFINSQNKIEKTRKKTVNKWFELQDQISYYKEFEKEKIVWASVGETYFSLAKKKYLLLDTNYFCVFESKEANKYILSLLNSKLLIFYLNLKDSKIGSVAYRHYKYNFEQIPIPKISKIKQKIFEKKANLIISLNKRIQTENSNFRKTLFEEKNIKKLNKKLQNFHELEYSIFKKELINNKVKLNFGKESDEWRNYFNTTKQKIIKLKTQINQTDNEINKMVYELYELTKQEIEMIEKSFLGIRK